MSPHPTPTDTDSADPSANGHRDGGTVVALKPAGRLPIVGQSPSLGWMAVLVTAIAAASPVASGYFSFSVWGPMALGAFVLLIVVAWTTDQTVTRRAMYAGGGLLALLALSAASILWAQSKEAAWTDTNRLALYAAVFLIGLLAIRDRRTARGIVMLLGAAALVTSIWFPISFLFGGNAGAFFTRRLNSPIGYINGTAGLLVMGIWPWLAYADTAQRREIRALALGAVALIAGTFVLTQSRAVIPATVLSSVLVLACAPGRTRRGLKLLVVAGTIAAELHWTLAVYSTGGASERLEAPAHDLLRKAAIAIILGGVIATLASLALSRFSERIEAGRRARLLRRIGLSAVAAVAIALCGGAIAGHSWISRQYHTFTALKVNESASTRFTDASGFRYDLWRIAWKEFTQNPIGGLGAGNYDADYYKWRRSTQYVLQPHSLELQMLAELGIGGLIALLVMVGAVFAGAFARAGTLASDDLLIRIGALGVFAAWLIDTSVDWLYDIPGLTVMALIAAALLVLPAKQPGPTERSSEPEPVRSAPSRRGRIGPRQVAVVTGLSVLALLAASVGRQYAASRYATSGANELSHSPKQAIGTLRTAIHLDPYALTTLYSLASAYARMDEYPQARAALQVAEAREPSNYVPRALLGDLAMRRGDVRVAVAAYEQALALNPRDPEVQQSLQAAKVAAGE